ncbi:hypothetical protein ACIRPQ_21255 [Streptomyces sp. NPDC101213]|uniref:hypothetical protein n=1 Tax=Streptomyces sp. NPDC101213 TaxID=3366130 RepID=UPI00382FECF4
MGQDDSRPPGVAPYPRSGEADLIGRPVAQAPLRTQPPERIADRQCDDGRVDHDAHHDHRIPIVDSNCPEAASLISRSWFGLG